MFYPYCLFFTCERDNSVFVPILWLISLSMAPSSSFYVVVNCMILFFKLILLKISTFKDNETFRERNLPILDALPISKLKNVPIDKYFAISEMRILRLFFIYFHPFFWKLLEVSLKSVQEESKKNVTYHCCVWKIKRNKRRESRSLLKISKKIETHVQQWHGIEFYQWSEWC